MKIAGQEMKLKRELAMSMERVLKLEQQLNNLATVVQELNRQLQHEKYVRRDADDQLSRGMTLHHRDW